MREHFTFVGKQLTPSDEARATHDLNRMRKEANEFDPRSELLKTAGEQASIELLNEFLNNEFDALNIPEIPQLRPDRFHIMSKDWFKKNLPDVRGCYFSQHDKIVLDRSLLGPPIQFYKTIFHEGIHAIAHLKFRVRKEEKFLDSYRTGYMITNTAVSGNDHLHLEAFNEGVVETTVEQMFHNGATPIQKKLGVSETDLKHIRFSYPLFRAVVQNICKGLAERSGKKSLEHWEQIKRGQFTGEMMHLRAIESAYGKGALRVLDALSIESGDAQERVDDLVAEKNEKVLAFFRAYDQKGKNDSTKLERGKLAQEILGEVDFQKYCR